MKRILPFLTIVLFLCVSCQKPQEPTGEVAASLRLSSSENTVWRNNTTRAATDTKDLYYVLDANGICQTAAKVDHATPATADKLLALSDYSVFCITNADPSGFPYSASMIGTDFTSQPMVLNTLTDVCFGQQPLTILAWAFYLHEKSRTRGFRKGEYLLIPPYDEYLIGYKSRDIVLDPGFKHFAHNNSGIFQPIIAYDGRICGNWSPFEKELNISFFMREHGNEDTNVAINKYRNFKDK